MATVTFRLISNIGTVGILYFTDKNSSLLDKKLSTVERPRLRLKRDNFGRVIVIIDLDFHR